MNKRPLPCVLAGFVLGEVWIYQFRGTAAKAAFCLTAILLLVGCMKWKSSFSLSRRLHLGRWNRKKEKERTVILTITIGLLLGGMRQWQWNRTGKEFEQLMQKDCCSIEGQIEEKKVTDHSVSVVLNHLSVDGEKCNGKVILYLEEETDFYIGCTMKAEGAITSFSEPTNPGEFNQKAYQEGRGIFGCVYDPEVFEVRYGSFLMKEAVLSFREKMAQYMQAVMEESQYGIAMAMVLGDKTALLEEQKNLFEIGGISHILAVSGLHMTLIGAGIYKLLRKMGLPYGIAVILSFPCIVFYAMMTGMSSSCLRASIMLLVYLFAEWKGYSYDLPSSLALSGLLLLWEIPARLFDSGFVLSFGAMIGVGIFYPMIEEVFDVSPLICNLIAGVSITVFTLPLSLYYFYGVSLAGLVLNLVVIPLMSVLVPLLSFGGLGWLSCFPTVIGESFLYLAGKGIDFYLYLCRVTKEIPGAYLRTGYRGILYALVYYSVLGVCVLVLLFMGCRKKEDRIAKKEERQKKCKNKQFFGKGIVIIGWTIFLIVFTIFTGRRDNYLTVLDVGQGDGILFHSKSGDVFMIDGGSTSNKKVGQYIIEPALEYYGIGKVDYWFVSHMDEDHISGVKELLEKGYSVENIILPDLKEKTKEQEEFEILAKENGTNLHYMSRGEQIRWEEGLFYCLHPRGNATGEDTNENSLVLLLAVDNQQILLTGDVEKEGEQEMTEYLSLYLQSNNETERILKVAHHGSANGTSEYFLNVFKPDMAIVSCGKNNRYGHPAKATVKRIEESNAIFYNTVKCGAIEIRCGRQARYYYYGSN